jgi:hypothetical protein
MNTRFLLLLLVSLVMASCLALAKETRATIVYDDVATEVNPANVEADQLWITTGDLTRATRFELKPQGVCRDKLCFPIPKARKQEFLRKNSGQNWFNLTAFAGLVHQPVAREASLST